MTRQEYKDWAKKKVQRLVEQHAAQTSLFNMYYDKDDQESASYYRRRCDETMKDIMAFIE